MKLTLIPRHGLPGETETTLFVAGDVLSYDGTPFDLSAIPEGGAGEWPDSPVSGTIKRIDGVLHVSVRVVLGPDAEAHQPTDPEHWIITNAQGHVVIPALRKPQKDETWD